MTYQEFKNKYLGKYVDTDKFPPGNPYQCFDLAQLYFTECLGLPATVLAGCGDVKNMLYGEKRKLMDQYFDKVPGNAMYPGDVIIWDWNHIAIFDHWDGRQNWFFNQNPGPSEIEAIGANGMNAFRLKTKKEQVAEPVPRDEYKDQIEVKVPDLRVRDCGSTLGGILGKAQQGVYNYYEVVENQGYKWYRITNDWRSQWIASRDDWTTVYPAKEPFKVGENIKVKGSYKIVDVRDKTVCVFMDNKEVWLPFSVLEKE